MKKKVLFIDRDGTLILEPQPDQQVDSLEKLSFYPGVFTYLGKIARELNYELVMVTNQDGLGTSSFPENTFWPAHNKMLTAFKNEGIEFKAVHIDSSLRQENAPTRKPNTGMLQAYIYGDYDLENSFVIGDRISDIELAKNLNAQAIYLGEPQNQAALCSTSWETIYQFLKKKPRKASKSRITNETKIEIDLNLDQPDETSIQTGIGFFDHMLEQIAKHAQIGLNIQVNGDLEVDEHHSIEDVAICLGDCFLEALADKKGINRYGFMLPMDDCLAQVAIDFGGRPWLVWKADFRREKIGDMPTEMFMHFFKSFSDAARCNLNIKAEGENEHHKIEAIFKAFARALRAAIDKNETFNIPSTKGIL